MARSPASYDWSAYEESIHRYMKAYGVPGAAVGVAVKGELVYFNGFGHRDRERQLPVTDRTVFGIGSITKSFTSMAVMQLAEQGLLALADPVRLYLPSLRLGKGNAADALTIHNLLTHTTGMPPLPTLMNCMARSMKADPMLAGGPSAARIQALRPLETAEEMMEFMAQLGVEPLAAPGAMFSYWNEGYALAGAIIEAVSGQDYASYVTEHILAPADMAGSAFDIAKLGCDPDLTTIYAAPPGSDDPAQVVAAPLWWESTAMMAAGFLRSNVRDMLRYLEIYRNLGQAGGERILTPHSVRQMVGPYIRMAAMDVGYGYGLTVHPNYHGVTLVEHGGGIKGVSAYVTLVPERHITAVLLTNLGGLPSGQMLLGAVNTALGLPVPTRRWELRDYACPPDRLAWYAGAYASGEGATAHVDAVETGLACTVEGKRYPARPIGMHTFAVRMREDEVVVRFLLNAKGEVWAVELGGRTVPKVDGRREVPPPPQQPVPTGRGSRS
jgi:CubicO group peptidase (beta-lactamase class C family)